MGRAWGNGMGEERKDRYGSREVYISTKGAILGFARDLILEGGPRRFLIGEAQGEVPRFFPGQQRRGCLNWP